VIPLNEIVQAKRQISHIITNTPCALAPLLSEEVGAQVYLKKENLQITGAYKLRGAYNKIASLSEEERQKGVIAASAGNHAQGVGYSARSFGISATIVMPEATPLLKVSGTKALGAEVILHGDNYDEAYAYALTYAKEHGLTFIHPLDVVVIPIGGGGLISGMASAIKQIDPKIKIIGVNAAGAPAMCQSFHAKKAINSKSVRTIADGIAVRDVSESNLAHILECVDEVVTVDEEEIAAAILFLLERQKLVVEGGGAASVAAIMHQKFPFSKETKIGAVLSGGNIDVQMLSIIIEKGLIKSHRKMKLVITLIDKPGSLMRLTDLFKNANANIIQIDYDRFSTKLSYGDAQITIMLETKGHEHQEEIRRLLNEAGYLFKEEV